MTENGRGRLSSSVDHLALVFCPLKMLRMSRLRLPLLRPTCQFAMGRFANNWNGPQASVFALEAGFTSTKITPPEISIVPEFHPMPGPIPRPGIEPPSVLPEPPLLLP